MTIFNTNLKLGCLCWFIYLQLESVTCQLTVFFSNFADSRSTGRRLSIIKLTWVQRVLVIYHAMSPLSLAFSLQSCVYEENTRRIFHGISLESIAKQVYVMCVDGILSYRKRLNIYNGALGTLQRIFTHSAENPSPWKSMVASISLLFRFFIGYLALLNIRKTTTSQTIRTRHQLQGHFMFSFTCFLIRQDC